HDNDRGDDWHDRQPAGDRIRNEQRGKNRDHESRSGGKNAVPRIGDEEQHKRPEIERKLEHWVELRAFWHRRANLSQDETGESPAMARAKSRAENGAKSSTASPTPT